MIIMCGESAFDLGKLNDYKPDGQDIYCKFAPATYKPETVPEKDFGAFARAEDNGVIYFSDIAFKMLADLSIRAGLDNFKYIAAEAGRAGNRGEDGEYILSRPSTKRPLGAMLAQHGVRNVLMPDDAKIVAHNLKALGEYDMVGMMCSRARFYDKKYADACLDIVGLVGDYIFLGKATKSLWHLHAAMTELFRTFSIQEFSAFADKLYGLMNKIPGEKYARELPEREPKPGTEEGAEIPVIPETKAEPAQGSTQPDADPDIEAESKRSETAFSHKLRKVSVTDIIGLDETYAEGYCESFYDKELQDADSEGFLEKLIIARTNEGAAPIDLLSEAITREHAQYNEADILKRQIESLRKEAFETLGGNPGGLPDDAVARISDPEADNDGEPALEKELPEAPPADDFKDAFPDDDSDDGYDGGDEEVPNESYGDEGVPEE